MSCVSLFRPDVCKLKLAFVLITRKFEFWGKDQNSLGCEGVFFDSLYSFYISQKDTF